MSGEFTGFVLLGILWFLLSLIGKGSRKSPRDSYPRLPPDRPGPDQLPTQGDATQREGLRLETVLGGLRRALEEAAEQAELPNAPLETRAELALPESLEVEPEVRSLEGEVKREVRRRVDLDDEGADVEARRIQAAATRDAPRSEPPKTVALKDTLQQPADHTSSRAYTAQQLRDAVVWREILGPPVSMRDLP